MQKRASSFVQALGIFAGTVIGVGFFSLPYVASKSGFSMLIFYFLLLTPVVIVIHFLLADICCGTTKTARLPGYAEEFLGSKAKKISFISIVIGFLTSQLTYIVIGGQFLFSLYSPKLGGTLLIYTLIFWGIGIILILAGIKSIAESEVILMLIFFAILGLLFSQAVPHLNKQHFFAIKWHYWFLPYGPIMFSLWGSSIIPEIKDLLGGDRTKVRLVIGFGSLLIALAYIFFTVIVLGVTGASTSEEAMNGLAKVLGGRTISLGYIFGLIAIFTSFLSLGLTLQKTLQYDFGRSKFFAWTLSSCVPIILFLLGLNNFIKLISFSGALLIGLEAVLIVLIYRAYRHRLGRRFNPWLYGFLGLLIAGVVIEIVML